MPDTYINRHGRKGGRGLRPWLLIPKIIAVAVYVGGLATVLGLWLASDFTSFELIDPRRDLVIRQVSRVMVCLVVPALLVALLLGVALLLQHPREFLRMRWLQIKLISLVILIPAAHLYCRSCFQAIRHAPDKASSDQASARFTLGIGATLAASVWVVVLGRLKPRLNQRLAELTPPLTATKP
jgi:uncharacterized membrane protein